MVGQEEGQRKGRGEEKERGKREEVYVFARHLCQMPVLLGI